MYFEELPNKIQKLIKEKILEAYQSNTNDAYPYNEEALSEVECHARDGFRPFSHNRGGVQARGFQDLMNIFGSGCYPKAARKVIEDEIDYNLKALAKDTFEQFKEILEPLKLKPEDCRYHVLDDLIEKHPQLKEQLRTVQRAIEDGECEALTGDENSVMYEIRFMYHGVEKGIHSASISVVVNTEAPYFRSSISWMPSLKCEHGKEVEITWKTANGLKTKLDKTLKKLTKEVL